MRIRCGFLAFVLSACAQGTVIVSVSSTTQNSAASARLFSQTAFATGWTQTGSYQSVSVSALIFGGQHAESGTAYLVDAIGARTTVADQIASAPFSVPVGSAFSSPFVTLFSGLTLGPGTYYLVLTGNGPDFLSDVEWRMDAPVAVQTDAGVTSDPRALCAASVDPALLGGVCGFPLSGYIPASPFLDLNQANPNAGVGCPTCRFSLLVTSDAAAPEPAVWTLVAAGLLFVTLTGDRWRTRRTPPSA